MSIKLISNDQKIYEITKKDVKLSSLWREMVNMEDEDDEIQIPMDIKSEYLDEVVEFCKNYNEKEKWDEITAPLHSNNLNEHGVPDWANDFITKKDLQQLHQIILCANYLDIQPLLQLGCARVACLIRGKVPEEIKELWKDVKEIPIN